MQQAMISRARAANIPMLERRDPTPASPEGVFIPGLSLWSIQRISLQPR